MAEKESFNTMAQNSYIKLDDGIYAVRTSTSPTSGTQTVQFDQTTYSTSVMANGKQAAPAANTDIAVTTDLTVGAWDIEATISILGTTVANVESTNVVFRIGGTTVATPTVNVPGTAGSTSERVFRTRINLAANSPVSIRSGTVAATAGSIYVADIVATKYEGP